MTFTRRPRRTAAAATALTLGLVLAPLPASVPTLLGGQTTASAAEVMTVPTGVLVDPGVNRFFVQWTANTDTATGYQVRYTYPTLGLYGIVGTSEQTVDVPGRTTTSSTVNGAAGLTYKVQVRAVYGSGSAATYSGWSAEQQVTPTSFTAPPARVAGGTATAGQEKVVLSWNAPPSNDGRTAVDVYRDGVKVQTVAVGTRSWTDTVVEVGREHRYTFVAVNSSGAVSAPSTVVSAVPFDTIPPAVPAGFTGVAGEGVVALSWSANNTEPDFTGYVLSYGSTTLDIPKGTTSTQVTGLTNAVTYAFSLRAKDRNSNSSAATTVSLTPRDVTPPSAPSAVTVTADDSALDVSWTASAATDTTGYQVLLDGTQVATTSSRTSVTTRLTGLTNGRPYTVTVKAFDAAGNVSSASPAVVGTPVDKTPPGAPSGVSATAGDTTVRVTWLPNPETDVARYHVVDSAGTVLASVTAGTTTHLFTGLPNDVPQTYRVIAVDATGNPSTPSAAVTATPRDTTPPAQPHDVVAVAGDGSATLTWAPNTETDLASYRVVDASGTTVATVAAPTTTVTVRGLTNGTPYAFRVIALDRAGNPSGASAPVTVTPRDTTPPQAPGSATATAGDRSATVSWAASSSGDVTGYRVLSSGGATLAVVTGAGTSTVVGGLTNGQDYTFLVVAVDAAGNVSEAVATNVVRPVEKALPAPTGLSGAAGDAAVSLTWAPVSGAARYELLVDGVVVTTATSASATVTGLTNGRAYTFTVAAVSGTGLRGTLSSDLVLTPVARAVTGTLPQGSGSASGLAITRDGRFSVVGTTARLEAADTNSSYDLYVKDAVTGLSTRLDPTGAGTDLNASQLRLSADGRYVAVVTSAAKVASDTNRLPDVYRLDRQTGTWQLVSVPATGKVTTVAGTTLQKTSRVYATSASVQMSQDGRYVFFLSARSDLVNGDTNNAVDLFRKDVATGAVVRVSTDSSGAQLAAGVTGPAVTVTPDGRYVAFVVRVQNVPVAWRKDLSTGALDLASGQGAWGNVRALYSVTFDADDVSMSDDGRYVGFSALSQQLTPQATEYLAYRRDMSSTEIVPAGLPGARDVWERQVTLDPTGRYAFFSTTRSYGADQDGRTDWYRRDLGDLAAAPVQVTTTSAGLPGPRWGSTATDSSEFGAISVLSADEVVVSTKQVIVDGDVNGLMDVVRKHLGTGRVWSVLG